jgi:hypothetical protein
MVRDKVEERNGRAAIGRTGKKRKKGEEEEDL